ncbi:MAG: hypothetical protein JF603_03800, partial [Acidobacteria bacterium]|nr:hypothetical protein [Acidobacteriota bacterium]
MSRRIEVELTSSRDDGTWTWRAAGALQPRGELDGSLLPSGSKVGDVVRADADFDIEGITVLGVLPPKGARPEPERIEIKGSERAFEPVITTLAGRGGGGRGDRGERRPRSDRPGDRDRGPRPDRAREGDRDRGPRPPRAERPERPARPDRPRTPRPERPAPPPPKPKAKKLRAGHAHRDELLAALSPEQQPIAEQLFKSGMPGVRTALTEQNTKAKAEGLPEMPEAMVLGIAEDLLPRVRVADWLDRAEGAAADAEEIALRDLRAVVASAADVARDESTRELASSLKEVLDRRAAAEQQAWLDELTTSLAAGRVVRALRLASRPPEPTETLSAELTTQLADAASAAMAADTPSDRWATLIDALAYSPVRRAVAPAGKPEEPTEELLTMVRKHAGRTPTVAALFGIEPPAPKAPRRAPKPKPKRAAEVQAAAGLLPPPPGTRRIPPPPPPRSAPPAPAPVAPAPVADATDAETPAESEPHVPPALPAAPEHAALPAGEAPVEHDPIALESAPEPIAMPSTADDAAVD